jgi:chaperonin cofactor prefoldin
MSLPDRIIKTGKAMREDMSLQEFESTVLHNQYQIMLGLQEILSRLEDLEDIDNDPDLRDPEFGPA